MEGPVAGFTSTGSKRPGGLFGGADGGWAPPARMVARPAAGSGTPVAASISTSSWRSAAVALGYGHPAVTRARRRGDRRRRRRPAGARARGGGRRRASAGSCPGSSRSAFSRPARRPWPRRCGSPESPPAAIWCWAAAITAGSTGAEGSAGVPAGTRALYGELPFNDAEATRRTDSRRGRPAGRVVFEPIVVLSRARMARRAAGGDRAGRRGADRGRDQDRLPARAGRGQRALRHSARISS